MNGFAFFSGIGEARIIHKNQSEERAEDLQEGEEV